MLGLWRDILSLVKECITDVAKELGYPEMKPEQLEVAATFIEGRDVFFSSVNLSNASGKQA